MDSSVKQSLGRAQYTKITIHQKIKVPKMEVFTWNLYGYRVYVKESTPQKTALQGIGCTSIVGT